MPKPYPKEFRDDVVPVARQRGEGVTIKQIAKDFGISEPCLTNWMAQADRDAGFKTAPTAKSWPSCARPNGASACWRSQMDAS